MKPVSLCLVEMGKKGLELVRAYPEVLPEEVLNQIVVKSMPFSARDGDFTSNNVENSVFSGYVFSIPSSQGRANIAALVAVFSNMKYDSEAIKKVFSFTITELKKNDLVAIDTVAKILPSLYKGLIEENLRISISSTISIEFDFKGKKKDKDQEALNGFRGDVWK